MTIGPWFTSDWDERERLVEHEARGRCECIALGHGHSIERCARPGVRAQHRGDRTDNRLPNLMWVCAECARPEDPETEVIDFRALPITSILTRHDVAPDTVPMKLGPAYLREDHHRGGTDDRPDEARFQGLGNGFRAEIPGGMESRRASFRGRHCRA